MVDLSIAMLNYQRVPGTALLHWRHGALHGHIEKNRCITGDPRRNCLIWEAWLCIDALFQVLLGVPGGTGGTCQING